ncbi:tyrosine-type recombinase/integrase [Lactobacillus crispatus]|uniref:tyrosine-type recombinase/integrase n=1 Tax=Lactobacillus crispatus TaxID=47770 RepID=UPI0030FCE75A
MTVYKRGKAWSVQVSWYTVETGGKKKRHYKTKGGFKTKKEAELWETQEKLAKSKGQISDKNPVFADYFRRWYEVYRKPGAAANTQKIYEYVAGVLEGYFGGLKIRSLTSENLQTFLNDFGKDHSRNTATKVFGNIKSCLTEAFDEGLIHKNLSAKLKLIYNEDNARPQVFLSAAEIESLASYCEQIAKPNRPVPYMILTALFTGMRLGEIMALSWPCIDYTKNTIKIERSWAYKAHELKSPKNKASDRIVPVPTNLLNKLNELKGNDERWVFVRKNARHDGMTDDEILRAGLVDQTTTSADLKRFAKKAGVKDWQDIHMHTLRHAHVAYLAYKNVNWYAISKRLGHSNLAITLNTYAYLIDELKASEDEQIIDILNGIDKGHQ